MGRTITRWASQPHSARETIGDIGTDEVIDFGTSIRPDRLIIWSDTATLLAWTWNDTAAVTSLEPPADGAVAACGLRMLRADESQVIEMAGGGRYFHLDVSATCEIYVEYGIGAGAGS